MNKFKCSAFVKKKKISCLRQTKTQIDDIFFFFEKAKIEYIKQLNGELGNSIGLS